MSPSRWSACCEVKTAVDKTNLSWVHNGLSRSHRYSWLSARRPAAVAVSTFAINMLTVTVRPDMPFSPEVDRFLVAPAVLHPAARRINQTKLVAEPDTTLTRCTRWPFNRPAIRAIYFASVSLRGREFCPTPPCKWESLLQNCCQHSISVYDGSIMGNVVDQ
ncbi:hypothetical protein J6590_039176 [Homalodisca vitripennis]|nr:hypothetical protein J6590_039176 [Homalodisca vitripennis]